MEESDLNMIKLEYEGSVYLPVSVAVCICVPHCSFMLYQQLCNGLVCVDAMSACHDQGKSLFLLAITIFRNYLTTGCTCF